MRPPSYRMPQHDRAAHVRTRVVQGASHLGQRCAGRHHVVDENNGCTCHVRPRGHAVAHIVCTRREPEPGLVCTTPRRNKWLPQPHARVVRDEIERFKPAHPPVIPGRRRCDEAKRFPRDLVLRGSQINVEPLFEGANRVCESGRQHSGDARAATVFDGMKNARKRDIVFPRGDHGNCECRRGRLRIDETRVGRQCVAAIRAHSDIGETASRTLGRKYKDMNIPKHVTGGIKQSHHNRIARVRCPSSRDGGKCGQGAVVTEPELVLAHCRRPSATCPTRGS